MGMGAGEFRAEDPRVDSTQRETGFLFAIKSKLTVGHGHPTVQLLLFPWKLKRSERKPDH
jgi:hypothetical protein